MDFTKLSLIDPLLRAVAEAGYTQASPIQQKAIPPVLQGRDLLGCAQTGTGKTAAFALPILQLLTAQKQSGPRVIRALVLTPTRELALQIQESFAQYGRHLPLRSAVIFGGVGQAPQVAQLKKGIDILVATPGRLNDLIGQGYVKLGGLSIFVLDEADRMLDMGFIHDVKKVLRLLPAKKQTLLFSATLPDEIVSLANGLLHNPARVFVTPVSSTVDTVEHQLYKVDKTNKRHLLAHLLRSPEVHSALVFTRTKHGADRVVRELSREKITAMAIHGNKSQGARQTALSRFKKGDIRVLVATDIAARGIDIQELSHVFNYDLPNIPETYVHRIGRTGRAGHSGIAVSFCCAEELEYLRDIEKLAGFSLPEVKNHAWPMQDIPAPAMPAPQQGGKARPAAQKQPQPQGEKGRQNRQKQPAPPAKQPKADNSNVKKGRTNPPPAAAPGRQPRQENPPAQPTGSYGGHTIVTRRPVWGSDPAPAKPAAARPQAGTAKPSQQQKGENDMGRNNRNRNRRGRGNAPQEQASSPASAPGRLEKPKNENGVFDFSERELAEDQGLQVISRTQGEVKFANFEDFLKNK